MPELLLDRQSDILSEKYTVGTIQTRVHNHCSGFVLVFIIVLLRNHSTVYIRDFNKISCLKFLGMELVWCVRIGEFNNLSNEIDV